MDELDQALRSWLVIPASRLPPMRRALDTCLSMTIHGGPNGAWLYRTYEDARRVADARPGDAVVELYGIQLQRPAAPSSRREPGRLGVQLSHNMLARVTSIG